MEPARPWLAFRVEVQEPPGGTGPGPIAGRAAIADDVVSLPGARLHVEMGFPSLFPFGIPYFWTSSDASGVSSGLGVSIRLAPDASGFANKEYIVQQIAGGCVGWTARDESDTFTLQYSSGKNPSSYQTLTLNAASANADMGIAASMGAYCVHAAMAPHVILSGAPYRELSAANSGIVDLVNSTLADCITALFQDSLLLDRVLDDALRLHGPRFDPIEGTVHSAAHIERPILIYLDIIGVSVRIATARSITQPEDVTIARLPITIALWP